MSKTLLALVLPFLHLQLYFGDGETTTVIETPEAEQEKPAEPASTPETVEETPKDETVTDTETKPEKTFTQAELDEIVQKRIAKLERKAERARIEAETRAKVLEEVKEKPVAVNKPTSDQFKTYDEYLEALADYKAEEKINSLRQQELDRTAKERQQSEASRVSERQAEMLETGERKYEDFEEVVRADKTVYSQAALLSMIESDQSADIVYHLAKNPEEAKRIAALPAYAQAKEIGKLEDRLSAKKPIKVSNAPEPIKPVDGGKNFTKKLEDMTIDEMIEHDRKRGAKYIR